MQKSKKTTRISIKDLPKRKHTVTKEEANQVKGGLKMLTAANQAANEAKGLAVGINKSQ